MCYFNTSMPVHSYQLKRLDTLWGQPHDCEFNTGKFNYTELISVPVMRLGFHVIVEHISLRHIASQNEEMTQMLLCV